MARRKRRNHSPEFKAKVAMAAIKGDKTLAEMAQQFDVHPNQITDWKTQL
ncbi:MAG: transposase, partial [Candidatus Dechloromonas phosphoritropha]